MQSAMLVKDGSDLESVCNIAPTLSILGDQLLVPFKTKKLARARVLWLNERWFLEAGCNILSRSERTQIEETFLGQFAYSVPHPRDPEGTYCEEEKVFYADRYGGAGIGVNGGSGRTGICGAFGVKGIGRTPLVGEGGDIFHTHGFASQEEGIREAILSEIACQEFPHQAIPVVGLIDPQVGIYWSADPTVRSEQRALIVRPAFVRPAHFQRAIGFVGTRSNEHLADASRVGEAVLAFCDHTQKARKRPWAAQSLREFVKRISTQVAFGHAQRLFHGMYTGSNMSIDGELADFGSFRAARGWRGELVAKGGPPFGQELVSIAAVAKDLAFYFRKYGPPSADHDKEDDLLALMRATYETEFRREVLRLWQLEDLVLDSASDDLFRAILTYFREEQKLALSFLSPAGEVDYPWIYEQLHGLTDRLMSEAPSANLSRIDAGIRRALDGRSDAESRRRSCWATAQRMLLPRKHLYRANLQRWLYKDVVFSDTDETKYCHLVTESIRKAVSLGRRHWPNLPKGLVVIGQVSQLYSHALWCYDPKRCLYCLWIEGTVLEDGVALFGAILKEPGTGAPWASGSTSKASFLAPLDRGSLHRLRVVPATAVALPSAEQVYETFGILDEKDQELFEQSMESGYLV